MKYFYSDKAQSIKKVAICKVFEGANEEQIEVITQQFLNALHESKTEFTLIRSEKHTTTLGELSLYLVAYKANDSAYIQEQSTIPACVKSWCK